jgi:hypothetical protein
VIIGYIPQPSVHTYNSDCYEGQHVSVKHWNVCGRIWKVDPSHITVTMGEWTYHIYFVQGDTPDGVTVYSVTWVDWRGNIHEVLQHQLNSTL